MRARPIRVANLQISRYETNLLSLCVVRCGVCNAVKVTHMDKNDEFIISDKTVAYNNKCIAHKIRVFGLT